MKILTEINTRWQTRKAEKAKQLRAKNEQLRKEGKDPLQGWNTMVDTGLGGLNKITSQAGSGTIDFTGKNDGTFNFYSEEQKALGKTLDKK